MSEIPTVRRPCAGYIARQWATTAVAALMWILAIGLGAPLDRVLGVLASDVALAAAGTVSLAAVILWTVKAVWSALADNLDALAKKVAESADANYRRGLVNGAQQLADGVKGLRQVP